MIKIVFNDPYFEFVPTTLQQLWGYKIKRIKEMKYYGEYYVLELNLNIDKKCKNKQDMLRAMLFYRNRTK